MEAALVSAAELICKLTIPPLATKINSIRKNEEQIKELADTIDLIRDVLDGVEGIQFQQESMNTCYKRLRNVFLDVEDFLDGVQTHKEKKDLKARMLKEEKEEIVNKAKGKFKILKRPIRLVGIKLKSCKIKAQRFISTDNQVKYAHEVNGTIAEVKRRLNAIVEDMQKLGLKVHRSTLAATQMAARASGPYVNPANTFGRDEDTRKIIDLLLRSSIDQPEIPVVSIVAPGGMGKTTLAQLVYNDESWQQSFQFKHKVWVSDSKRLDLKSLLKHVLKSICSDTGLDNHEEDHLKKRIVEIIQGGRFLLVLDDVENEDHLIWDNLKKLLDCGSKESRILVTTRSKEVARVVGSIKSTHHLTGLSKEGSLQLFESYAFGGGTRDESLVKIGNLIVEKCYGVPLAIKVVGSLLRYEGIRKWEYFQDKSLAENTDVGKRIMDILKLSYIDLDPTLKRCFSFCALFPKNYRISREVLSDIWMANVRFTSGFGETVEDACDKSLRILYNRCFLEAEMKERDHDDTHLVSQDEWDGVARFKLHDLMHDLVKEVAGAEILMVNSDERSIEEDARHIMLDNKLSKFEPKGRRVRSFLDRSTHSRMLNFDKFVMDCPVLRYLDLFGLGSENLAGSIGKLVHLRYLHLSYCVFQTLPHSIVELINLRKLKLPGCKELTRLPSGMGALTCLEVLDLSNCEKLEELPRGIEKLMKLRKLLLRSCKQLAHLPPRMGALTSLEVLDVSDCSELKELPMGIMKLLKLKKLLGYIIYNLVMPSGMGALFGVCEPAVLAVGGDPEESNHTAQLEELGPLSDLPAKLVIVLHGKRTTLKEGGDGDETLSLHKKSLRKLEIKWTWQDVEEEVGRNQMEVLGKLQPPIGLEKLTLRGYQGMAFPGWMPRDGFASVLPNLEYLYLYDCKGFRYLPPLSRLNRLRILHLAKLSSLQYIVEEGDDSEATCCLPQLTILFLWCLPEFKGWCGGENTKHSVVAPSLWDIKFLACPNVTVPMCRSILKAVDLSSSSFDYLFAEVCTNHGMFRLYKGMDDSWKLEIWKCDDTERASSIYMKEAFRGLSHCLTHLKFIFCNRLKTLPGLHYLTALRELEIQECPDFTWEQEDADEEEEQRRVEEDDVGDDIETTPHQMDSTTTPAHHLSLKRLATLHTLSLCGLPKLLTLPKGLQYITSLQYIRISNCESLQVPDWAHAAHQT